MDYLEIVSTLPLPTSEQTNRFAEHVARNHSWYKHLPYFPPGASFVFFLNPNAGMGVQHKDGVYNVFNVERADYFQHHSRLTTVDYLARFGHWDYWVDDNPRYENHRPKQSLFERFQQLFRPGLPPEKIAVEGPWIYQNDGADRVGLFGDVRQQSQCRFTAFLKPSPLLFQLNRRFCRYVLEAFQVYARKFPSDSEVVRYAFLVRALQGKLGSGCEVRDVWSCIAAEDNKQKERWLKLFQIPCVTLHSEGESSQQEHGGVASRPDVLTGCGADDCIELHQAIKAMLSFMEAETSIQRDNLLRTLQTIRDSLNKG